MSGIGEFSQPGAEPLKVWSALKEGGRTEDRQHFDLQNKHSSQNAANYSSMSMEQTKMMAF